LSRYKLLALDIDGTTLNSRGTVSDRVCHAIARAKHAGMLVTLATGRSLQATVPVAHLLDITAPLVISNGALVISPRSGELLLHRALDRAVAVQAVQALHRMGFRVCANRFSLTGPDRFYEQEPTVPEQALLLSREPACARRMYDLAGLVASIDPLKVMTVDRTTAIVRAAERLGNLLPGAPLLHPPRRDHRLRRQLERRGDAAVRRYGRRHGQCPGGGQSGSPYGDRNQR
jgi:hypothetical protein